MKQPLFLPRSTDDGELYALHRDNPRFGRRRSNWEELWSFFEAVAYPDFRQQFKVDPVARWWEMFLGVVLIQKGLKVLPAAKNGGPDLCVESSDGNKVCIEAVTPSAGNPDRNPDALPKARIVDLSDPEVDQSVVLMEMEPTDSAIMRMTSSARSKLRQFDDWDRSGVVGSSDCKIIAINSSKLHGKYLMGMNFTDPDPRSFLYGLDPNRILQTSDGALHEVRRGEIAKANGSVVEVDLFAQDDYRSISGVLYSPESPFTDKRYNPDPIRLYLNPNATCPLPDEFTSRFEAYPPQ